MLEKLLGKVFIKNVIFFMMIFWKLIISIYISIIYCGIVFIYLENIDFVYVYLFINFINVYSVMGCLC